MQKHMSVKNKKKKIEEVEEDMVISRFGAK